MNSNFVVDFTLTFDSPKALDEFWKISDDVPKTVNDMLEMLEMDVDEARIHVEELQLQFTGTSDIIPGKKAFQNITNLPGIVEALLWYEGGDRLMGEMEWYAKQPAVVHHQYLPDKHKPEKDDMESMNAAYQAHFERETINVEDLWGYYAEKNS
jgi:hypothetical protein